MSFFPKFHEYVIFISIFGQLLNIWTDDGRRGKHTGCGSGCCPDCVSELYQKEKKRNRTSRGRTAGRAPVRVEAEDTESFVKEEHVAHRAVKEKDRRREGAERRNRNASGKPQERDVQHAAPPSASGRDIRLRTPEEARRAFIYSEIFNRKY